MNKGMLYIGFVSLFFFSVTAYSQQIMNGKATAGNVEITRQGDSLSVRMNLNLLSNLDLPTNRSVILTPSLRVDDETLTLPAIEIMGRKRYIYYLRNEKDVYLKNGKDIAAPEHPRQIIKRKNKTRQQIRYAAIAPYEKLPKNARLFLSEDECGCCQTLLNSQNRQLADTAFAPAVPDTFIPRFAYIRPEVEAVKARSEKGSAYIDFAVGHSDIQTGYRNNPAELSKIKSTIDAVRNDPDVNITHIAIKGFASPEGRYESNRRLAEARTTALSQYVKGLYGFAPELFVMAYEAEDWEGLRRFVAGSDLADRNVLLALIDGPLAPDAKEMKLKSAYPAAYRQLQEACFPALRHSDYEVEYTVRGFDIEEAKQIIRTHPRKLSLEEMYLVAQTYEPGSEESGRVFETAANLFPEAPAANLNAANAALRKNELKSAATYLDKAGDSPQAVNARAILARLLGDSARAEALFRQAASAGLEEARDNLEQLKEAQTKGTQLK